MTYTTLVSPAALKQNLNNPNWVVVDCRFSLANSDAGGYAYRHGHIPHARYAHLNKDLSSAVTGFTGRHPLPDFRLLAKKLGAWGIANDSRVVVYDDAGGAFAGRLWWLLRCLGHDKVAVLNGGIQHWQRQGYALNHLAHATIQIFRPYLNTACWLSASQVQHSLAKKTICLIDAEHPNAIAANKNPLTRLQGIFQERRKPLLSIKH